MELHPNNASPECRLDRRGSAALLRHATTGVSVLVFLLLWWSQSSRPLHLDDVDHFGIAKAIAETGKPLYYRGEYLPAMSGALHPPLNDYLLAGWFLIFGIGVFQARAFAVFFTLLHGAAVLLLLRCLCSRATIERLTPWFWTLFLLNPYTLQMSSMVDIDSSTYGPMLVILLWSIVRLSWRQGERRSDPPGWWEFGLVTLLVTACLWTKLTTVLLAIPFIFFLLLPRMTALRALATAALTATLGIALFLGSFWLACRGWGVDPVNTFLFLHTNATGGGHFPTWTRTLIFMGLHLARWSGFLPWLAVGAAILINLRSAIVNRHNSQSSTSEVLLLLTLATASTVYYCATRLTFSNAPFKYTFVYFGILMLPLAFLASRSSAGSSMEGQTRQVSWHLPAACGIVFSSGLYVALGMLGDSVIQHGWTRSSLLLLGLPAVAGGLACVLGGMGAGAARRPAQAVLRLALFFHLGVQLGVAFYQSHVEYSTTYDYGQRGLAETASFLRSRTDADDLISSMKDVGLLAGRRYIENYGAIYGTEVQVRRLIGAWESGRVRFIVFTEGIGQDQVGVQSLLKDWISHNARLVASFGHYRIYEPRAHGGAEQTP
jgi:hypothetical protein